MNGISLKSIKCESIKSIFTTIADADKITRAEISAATDLSLVTIGKVADALLDMNIVCQVKEVKPHAGRRAGQLTVNPDMFAVIIDMTSYNFRLSILNLRLDLIDKSMYTYDETRCFDDNFTIFMNDTYSFIRRRYNIDNCIGIGISSPGPYNKGDDRINTGRIPELCGMKLNDTIHRYFKNIPILIDSHINAAARSNVMHINGYKTKNIIYWYVSMQNLCGAYLVNGEIILGRDRHACDFGKMIDQNGITLEKRISACKCAADFARVLSQPVHNIIKILNPHAIIMEFDIPFGFDDIMPIMKKIMMLEYHYSSDDFPEFHKTCCKFRNSHRGLTMALRDSWIDDLVFKEEK